jgi:hypothetical protein
MTKIDQEKERQRLASLYAGMSYLELRKVGENPESLTDWTKQRRAFGSPTAKIEFAHATHTVR